MDTVGWKVRHRLPTDMGSMMYETEGQTAGHTPQTRGEWSERQTEASALHGLVTRQSNDILELRHHRGRFGGGIEHRKVREVCKVGLTDIVSEVGSTPEGRPPVTSH